MRTGISVCFLAAAVAALLSTAGQARADYVDPLGDTFGAGTHDIISVEGTFTPIGVRLTVNFAGPIAAPSSFSPNAVVGYIDIDLDQNPATGGTAPWGGPVAGGNSWINFFAPTFPAPHNTLIALGDEIFVDLFSELFHPGFVEVRSAFTGSIVQNVPISYEPASFSVDLTYAALGGDALFHFGVLVGTFSGATDRAPNGSIPLLIPEPNGLVLAGLGVLVLAGVRVRWRIPLT